MINRYMDSYVDRRMPALIEEWQIASRDVIGDMERRLGALENEIVHIRTFERTATERLVAMEARAQAIRRKRS
ncbi:MAG: hypothetical protein PHF57_13135 [Methanoregula sp.]|jgi:hypothetical protein|nr:hypothetical protein [Methanoregula sp.]MDD5025391.1 hypothetical protein [Methanoregula sp.]MDD5189143.1 hypothetical protein [Methanoregula sp.]